MENHRGCRCNPFVVTVTKLAEEMGVAPSTVHGLIRNRRLRGLRVPGIKETLVARRDLELLIAEALVETSEA